MALNISKGAIHVYLVIITSLLLVLNSCKEVFETDLTGKHISLSAPADSTTSLISSVHFFWNELEGAARYRLQIASPSFINLTEMITDTLVNVTQCNFVLAPGEYQWRIRGETGSTFSEYSVRTLFIDSTLDLSSQQILLQQPSVGYITNQTSVVFSWSPLYNASEYSFQLREEDWSGALAIPEIITSDHLITLEDIPEGTFTWGVRGESALSNTQYSTRSLTTDYTAPDVPTLDTFGGSTFPLTAFTLEWTRPEDNGTALKDSLYIYSDVQLTQVVLGVSTNTPSYTGSLETTGIYYWRVKCYDAAGNIGEFSSPSRSFNMQ